METKFYSLLKISFLMSMLGIAHANEAQTLADLAKGQEPPPAQSMPQYPNMAPGISPPNISGVGPIPLINGSSDLSSSTGSRDNKSKSKFYVLSSLIAYDGKYSAWADYSTKGFAVKEGMEISGKVVSKIDSNGVYFKGSKKVWRVGETIDAN